MTVSELVENTSNIVRVVDLTQVEQYVDYATQGNPYFSMHAKNLFGNHPDSTYVYHSPEKTTLEDHTHVVWCHKTIPGLVGIGETEWRKDLEDGDVVTRATEELASAFTDAVGFYPWSKVPRGVVISNLDGDMSVTGAHRSVNVDYDLVARKTMEAIKTGDEEMIEQHRIYLRSQFVHELTHYNREDVLLTPEGELASHMMQFIYEPRRNTKYQEFLEKALNLVGKAETRTGEQYSKAIYAGMLIVALRLAERNPQIAKAIDADPDSHKIGVLCTLHTLITEDDARYLQEELSPIVINTDGEELLTMAGNSESELGIKSPMLSS